MQRSKLLVLAIFLVAGVVGQEATVSIEISASGDNPSFRSEQIRRSSEMREFLEALRMRYRREGRLKVLLHCIELQWEEQDSGRMKTFWSVESSNRVAIDSIVAFGIQSVSKRTLSGILAPLASSVASEATIQKSNDLVRKYRFLSNKGDPYYATYGDDRIALVIPLEEDFHNSFSGMVGYQPGPHGRAGITGDVRLHAENLFGTASLADLWWYRKDRESQDFSLGYEEPFVWRFNLGIKARFHQNLQDGLYVKRGSGVSIVRHHSATGKWYVGGETETVIATAAGDSLGLSDHSVKSLVIENERETRDSPWNPSHGFYLWWKGKFGGFSSGATKSVLLTRVQVRGEAVKALSGRWHLVLGGLGGFVGLAGETAVPVSERFRFGGASTLRGYREQEFLSKWMIISQIEFRYRLNNESRIYFFSDAAVYDDSHAMPLSAGLGIQQGTPVGFLRLEYALNRNDTPSRGKIHFRLIGQF